MPREALITGHVMCESTAGISLEIHIRGDSPCSDSYLVVGGGGAYTDQIAKIEHFYKN